MGTAALKTQVLAALQTLRDIPMTTVDPTSLCELRPGIGLCDECSLPKRPQQYMGNGCMVCLDCIAKYNLELKEKAVLPTRTPRRFARPNVDVELGDGFC
jgi:hypothetical protein